MSPALVATISAERKKNVAAINDDVESEYHRGVKHLCESGIRNVPGKYILPVSERPHTDSILNGKPNTTEPLNLKLPVIDFEELQGSKRDEVLVSLANACENYGFFQLVNHSIPKEVASNMMDAAKRFFELPFPEREKYMSADIEMPVRYGTSFNQTKDGVFCWRDFLKLSCHPLADVLPHWPASPMDFRDMAVTYAKETKFLYLMVVDAILESLGLTTRKKETEEDDEIIQELKDGSQLMIVNCYPPCPEPDLTLGIPPHSDYGFLTLLLQDEVAGLQIQHQGKWVTVEPIPGSFVVNVGDHLEIFSNGKYKSVMHRVVVNSVESRVSVASLHSLPYKTKVRPSEKLINEANPRRYKDTAFATFVKYIKSCDSKEKNFLESRKLTLNNQ